MQKIACVIVTFNRKGLLKNCLEAILHQDYKPHTVYIIDNASTDGTISAVKDWGFYEKNKEGIYFKYVLNSRNEGSAGGQYLGIKTAFEDDYYDGIWCMDDDGVPSKSCLAELCPYLEKFDYLAPIVLSNIDKRSCSFSLNHEDFELFAQKMGAKDGLIYNWASPFNGVLYSNKLIKRIGYPKREMFIWGDENNYHLRAINSGFIPYTILSAIHYHPIDRVQYRRCLGRVIPVTDVDWKLYCCVRNYTYNIFRLYTYFPKNLYLCLRLYASYLKYAKISKFYLITDAFLSGLTGNFSRLNRYMH